MYKVCSFFGIMGGDWRKGEPRVFTTSLLSLMAISMCSSDQSAFIIMTPTTLTLSHADLMSSEGEVTIRCTGSPGETSLYSLKLSRVLEAFPNATPTTLLNILHHNMEPQIIYPLEGSSAFGSVTQNFLTLRMSRAGCGDAGLYMCVAGYTNNGVTVVTANDTLVVEAEPGYLTVSSQPEFQDWVVNQTVTLTCTGPLGTVTSDTQINWRWEFWDKGEADWLPYDGSSSDVTVHKTNELPCYTNGSSQLTWQLRLADSKRSYRCYVERNGVKYSRFAGRFEFGRVMSVSDGTENDVYDDGLLFGASVGVGCTVVLVLIIVLIVVMCLWKKRVICSDVDTSERTETRLSRPADDDSTTVKKKAKRSPTRSVALQTHFIVDDHNNNVDDYDDIDNARERTVSMTKMDRPPSKRAPLPAHAAHASSSSSSSSVALAESSKLFCPREEEAEEEVGGGRRGGEEDGMVFADQVVDLASAQQQQAAAEDVLRTLLSTRHVISWKVSGEKGLTSFIVHLSPSTHDVVLPGGMQQGRWRKKNAASAAQQHQHHLYQHLQLQHQHQHQHQQHQQRRAALPQPEGMLVALPEVPLRVSGGSYYYESPRR